MFFHLVLVLRDDHFSRSEAQYVGSLVWRGGKNQNISPERIRKLYRHVPEAADANHSDLFPLAYFPVLQRRISCYPRAKEWSGCGKIHLVGYSQCERFINDDTLG